MGYWDERYHFPISHDFLNDGAVAALDQRNGPSFADRRPPTASSRTDSLIKGPSTMDDAEIHPSFPYPTLLVHADDHLAPTTDIAPTLHPSTTYRYPVDEANWEPVQDGEPENPREPVYSRLSYSTTERVEKVLGELMGGKGLTMIQSS